MSKINLIIDGQRAQTDEGKTILQAAQEAGVYIPVLCHHPALKPTGECRLCVVEIEGKAELPTSCNTPAAEGLVVHTATPQIQQLRRDILELALSEHPHACLTCWRKDLCSPLDICLRNVSVAERCVTCPKNERCEFQKLIRYIGIDKVNLPYHYKTLPLDREDPLLERDYNMCVLCGRCVRVCQDVRGVKAIAFTYRGSQQTVGAVAGSLRDSGCTFCGACAEVCPTGAIMDKTPDRWKPLEDREAFLVPCKNNCPIRMDAPRYVRLIAEGRFADSLAVVKERAPFAGILGRVCFHPCETKCRRGEINEAIAIKALKRFVADRGELEKKTAPVLAPSTGKKVAVVGSGPGGLTVAYYLAKLCGHKVTIFEALPQAGGMMRVGIPEYRLPRDVLDCEIGLVTELGVELKTNTRVESVDELFKQGYNAVLLALGAHGGMKMGVEGEDSPGVMECVVFLREANLGKLPKLGNKVAVVGGGNAAMDAARTALRLGVKDIAIVYRRTRAEMPANPEEVEEAMHEGVKFQFLTAPSKITSEGGKVKMECLRMELGEPDASGRRRPVPIKGSEFVTEYDTVIAAIGQQPEIPATMGVKIGRGNIITVDKKYATNKPGVFAVGDVVIGAASVTEAIAFGREAAISIDKYLGGKGIIDEVLAPVEEPAQYVGRKEDFAYRTRQTMPCLPVAKRLDGFVEVELGFSEEAALAEANRCSRCDLRFRFPQPLPVPEKKAVAEEEKEAVAASSH